jgi:hypothetical protein
MRHLAFRQKQGVLPLHVARLPAETPSTAATGGNIPSFFPIMAAADRSVTPTFYCALSLYAIGSLLLVKIRDVSGGYPRCVSPLWPNGGSMLSGLGWPRRPGRCKRVDWPPKLDPGPPKRVDSIVFKASKDLLWGYLAASSGALPHQRASILFQNGP